MAIGGGPQRTRLLSLEDPYIREFKAIILTQTTINGGKALILDQTAFHPEGEAKTPI